MSNNLSGVKEFQQIVRNQVERAAADMGWNLSTQRSYAFQLWIARVITNYETTLDTEPEDAMFYARDLGADLLFEDETSSHLVLCQCKYQGFNKLVDEKEVNDFFNRHVSYLDTEWVRKHGSGDAGAALEEYAERIAAGYTATYYFVSTGKASERIVSLAQRATEEYATRGVPVACELLDFTRLKDYYHRSLSLEQSIPPRVEFDLPTGQFFLKEKPHRTIIAVVKGNSLQNLSRQYKQALYAFNIRGYLGNRGINQAISKTAADEPGHFFYFNNGVSAICTDFQLTGNHVVAQNFQVINGAQTVSSLAKQSPNAEIEVMFRLTTTESVKTEKGLNRKIIQYNNSQNAVKISDFRSNDSIQVHLENALKEVRPKGPLPKLTYIRKRAVGRKGSGYGVRLEDLAKIRYSFLYEPTLVHESPKALWTPKDEGGSYEKAFGIGDELVSAWSDETLDECLLAILLYRRIDETAKELGKRGGDEDMRFLRRLRFHALSLAGRYVKRGVPASDFHRVTRNDNPFNEVWEDFWPLARVILINVFGAAQSQGVTTFAFVRSDEKWQEMEKLFRLQLAAR